MDIKILSQEEQIKYYDEILEMLIAGDDDFVPPLSTRSSTTQKDLTSGKKSREGILNYFEEMKKQRFAVALENDNLLAFVSYKENYTNNEITTGHLPNIYLSTLISKPEARGKRLTQLLYGTLFDHYKDCNILTRTWSTNGAHIHILSKFNFETLCTLKNDRGEGIDTVYFLKRKDS